MGWTLVNGDSPQPDEDARTGPLAGERLAEARRLRQISLPDIARELHLDEPKVQALEENRFDMLGAPVFAKGHLRKYAEMVGVSVDAVMADYRQLTSADIAPPVVGEPRQRTRDINLGPWLVALPIVLMVLGAAYWWYSRTPQPRAAPAVAAPTSTTGRTSHPLDAAPRDAELPADAAATLGPATVEPAGVAQLAEPAPVPENAAPAAAASEPGQLELRLTYSGDCWTEVTDASGRRLFFDLGRNGRTVRVAGTAPFRVLLGDSNNVRLTVNGEPYAIEDAEFRGDTARLTIND
ncbi:MAG: RodZ domain-containing protein [Woeseia sp.]